MCLKYLHQPSMVHLQFHSKTIVEEEKVRNTEDMSVDGDQ